MPREGLEGSLMRVLIGNTAERVLESLPCDVLVVKPEGFEKPRISATRTAMPVVRRTKSSAQPVPASG